MKLSPAQQTAVISALCQQGGRAVLRCDGYEITLQQAFDDKAYRFVVMVYVNGKCSGAMMQVTAPEHKFFRRVKRFVHTAKFRKGMKKIAKKGDLGLEIDTKTVTFWPWFMTPKSALAHLQKVCESIELVDPTL